MAAALRRERDERHDEPMSEPMRLKGQDADAAAKKRTEEGGLWETVKVILQAVVIAIVVRTLLFQNELYQKHIPVRSGWQLLERRRLKVSAPIWA